MSYLSFSLHIGGCLENFQIKNCTGWFWLHCIRAVWMQYPSHTQNDGIISFFVSIAVLELLRGWWFSNWLLNVLILQFQNSKWKAGLFLKLRSKQYRKVRKVDIFLSDFVMVGSGNRWTTETVSQNEMKLYEWWY